MDGKIFLNEVYTPEEIKKRLISYGVKQKILASKLRVSEQFMSRVLTGKVPGKHLRLKISIFLQSLEK